ncbi:ras-specific guanine nucleotide-releasing factor 2-like isoform X3 [Planococcus citri]|uniref:ras-specific guanine nucleotide-releasing factor 2-like isoform X3 n=1 Tax=Planococcus citri TaxID=170843 RepID=UPI0031F7D249
MDSVDSTRRSRSNFSPKMLSPKMQRSIRVNDSQLVMLSERAHFDHSRAGYLHKRTADSNKWQLRWFVLYQNLLFYYDSEACNRPSGVVFLEGCYCERIITTTGCTKKDLHDKQLCFAISYRRENQRQYELRASNEADCQHWVEAIRDASFNKLLLQKEELEQKHLHLLQIVESEKTAKWQYTQQCEDLAVEIKKLRSELYTMKKEWKPTAASSCSNISTTSGYEGSQQFPANVASSSDSPVIDAVQLQKIKKVQSFFRGWLCRRRWKQIVEQYIKSPHAESMRKRNCLVFRMVEEEEEYLKQLDIIVSCFLRPLRMAACSQKPPCTHEDINSIFLNVETILFLHQIFYKGLSSRMESWPTLILGDLFNMLIPMLSIYQEYVRNHHYSVQVLTECKQSAAFSTILDKLENKPACHSCQLDTFLMTPMHQIPRYIVTLHELLAHTPHDHVDRKSLMEACQKLEDLSRQIKDEVSETENLRKNLAIERMIVSGCDILLDVNQVYVREGRLVHYFPDRSIATRVRWSLSKTPEKIAVRYCYLFSNHLILTTRDPNGKLHLVQDIGRIPLVSTKLIEDPSDNHTDEDGMSVCTHSQAASSNIHRKGSQSNICESQSLQSLITCPQHHDFKLVIEKKGAQPETVHLYALTMQEKAAWISDISQCLDNVRFSDFVQGGDASMVTMPHCVRNDPKLFQDDVDIRFSRTLNSCKVPKIRYATPERLLERLTDLRFLSIDFLNTFLLTYKVFTDGVTVLEALKKVYYDAEPPEAQTTYQGLPDSSMDSFYGRFTDFQSNQELLSAHLAELEHRGCLMSPRRISASSMSGAGYDSETSERERSSSYDSQGYKPFWRFSSFKKVDEELLCQIKEITVTSKEEDSAEAEEDAEPKRRVSIRVEEPKGSKLDIPPNTLSESSSSETLMAASAPSSPGNLSSTTLVALSTDQGTGESSNVEGVEKTPEKSAEKLTEKLVEKSLEKAAEKSVEEQTPTRSSTPSRSTDHIPSIGESISATSSPIHMSRGSFSQQIPLGRRTSHMSDTGSTSGTSGLTKRRSIVTSESQDEGFPDDISCTSSKHSSIAYPISFQNFFKQRKSQAGMSEDESGPDSSRTASQRSSVQHDRSRKPASKAGVVITSSRQSKRRSSTSATAAAFAIATSASSNPRDISPQRAEETQDLATSRVSSFREKYKRKDSILSTAATMRVLNVLKHWVSKHSQDFDENEELKTMTINFLNEIIAAPNLLQAEQKVANQLLNLLNEHKDKMNEEQIELNLLFTTPSPTALLQSPNTQGIEKFSALEIAEEMTYIDHKIFISIRSQEFLANAWMKEDKAVRAPHIILMTKRFNEGSQLVASEIIRRTNMSARVNAIEKWTAVADIARCLRNYNGVLQICAAFTTSPVYRLKKTWEKVSKSTRSTIKKLQLTVSSDGRFRNLRDTLRRSEPPCIPYLGMYLSDLSFIEEGTPNFTEDGLLNFSKMRMIAHVIREVRCYQDTRYSIEHNPKVSSYLLNKSLLLDDEELYRRSLELEPRTSRLSITPLSSVPQNLSSQGS